MPRLPPTAATRNKHTDLRMPHPLFVRLAPFLPIPSANEIRELPAVCKSVWRSANPKLRTMLAWSMGIHALVIALRFIPEDTFGQWDKQAMQVVLVNAPSDANPADVTAQALAQSTLAGGGQADDGMVQSPLPNAGETRDGDALIAAQRQVQVLEREQAALLAALKSSLPAAVTSGTHRNFNPTPGMAQDNTAEAFMRQVAVLDKQVQDYNSRPRRKQLSPATKQAAFAAYYAQWSERLEKLGTENYPEAARGKSGEVVVTVSIKPNGTLLAVEVTRSSGDRALDRAALRLLQLLAPYQPFWGELKAQVDVLDITTRLIFTPAQALRAETVLPPR